MRLVNRMVGLAVVLAVMAGVVFTVLGVIGLLVIGYRVLFGG